MFIGKGANIITIFAMEDFTIRLKTAKSLNEKKEGLSF